MSALMEQHEAHVARQRRLGFAKPVDTRHLVVLPFEHVEGWGVPVNLLGVPSALTLIRLVALKHGVLVADIKGESHARSLVAVRDHAIGLVYTHCEPMSTPQLGRLFGGRDHSTVLHSLRKQGIPRRPTSYVSFWSAAPGAEDTLRRMWLGGSTIRQIAGSLGVTPNTVVGRMRRMRADGRLPYGHGLSASTGEFSPLSTVTSPPGIERLKQP